MEKILAAMRTMRHIRCVLGVWSLAAVALVSGGGRTCILGGALRVPSHDFLGENARSGLHWLYLAMILLKTLFWKLRLSPGRKPKIYDRATTTLVLCFLLGGVAFGESRL